MDTIITLIVGLVGIVVGVVLTKLTEKYFEKKKEAKLFIADLDDVVKWGWDGKKLLRHLIALDYETTDNLNEVNEGTPDQWAPVFMKNPDCWKLLAIRDTELVGYWSFFALKDNIFELAKQGQLYDSEITIENVVEIDQPGTYNIYVSIICIKENYRKKGFTILLNSFIDKLNELTITNRKIDKICVNAFSDEGRVLSKNFGLKQVVSHKEFGKIYFGNYVDSKSSRFARGKFK